MNNKNSKHETYNMIYNTKNNATSYKLYATRSGFTLIEMIVSVAIFSVIMTVSLGAILNISAAQKKISALRTVQDNINFTLNVMSREIRTGSGYGIIGSDFSFTNSNNDSIIYRLQDGRVERSKDGGINFSSLTDPKITIQNLDFDLSGESSGDGQPFVIIRLGATAGSGKSLFTLNLQTAVSQLIPDS